MRLLGIVVLSLGLCGSVRGQAPWPAHPAYYGRPVYPPPTYQPMPAWPAHYGHPVYAPPAAWPTHYGQPVYQQPVYYYGQPVYQVPPTATAPSVSAPAPGNVTVEPPLTEPLTKTPTPATPPDVVAAPAATLRLPSAEILAAPPSGLTTMLGEPSGACSDGHCQPAERGCRKRCHVWGQVEYLMWWMSDAPTPLVTTGDPNDPVSPGALGRPGTSVIFGSGGQDLGSFSGGRVSFGLWGPENRWGGELSGFWLPQGGAGFVRGSDALGNPPLYMPGFLTDIGQEGAFTISDPALGLTGTLAIASSLQMWGAESNGLFKLCRGECFQLSLLFGLRFVHLEEELRLAGNLADPGQALSLQVLDRFSTRNEFYGGQLGGKMEYRWGPISLGLAAKVALGNVHQEVDVEGGSQQTGGPPGTANGTFAGGIFTAPTNIGGSSTDRFAILPHVQFEVGCFVFPNLKVFGGYDLIYWNNVVRPGDQIDRAVNRSQLLGGQLVGEPRPAPRFETTDFWAQGLRVGLELRY